MQCFFKAQKLRFLWLVSAHIVVLAVSCWPLGLGLLGVSWSGFIFVCLRSRSPVQSHVSIHARAGERGIRIQGTGVCRVVHAPCAQDLRDKSHTWSTRLRLLPRPWCFSLMLHVSRVCVINHAFDSAGLACKSPPLSEVGAVLAGGDGHAYSPCPGLRMHTHIHHLPLIAIGFLNHAKIKC